MISFIIYLRKKKMCQVFISTESTKLRALRGKNVLPCQRALRAHVQACLAC